MTADFSLEGRTALVTGASSGLGRAFAGMLADAGAKVVLGARRREKCAEAAAEIGDAAIAVELDVADPASIAAALDAAEAAFGTVTILVNNAGTVVDKAIGDTAPDDWRRVIDTNLTGCWLMTQAVAGRLKAAGKPGRIVNISSMLGETVTGRVHAYAASKAGINQLTRTTAMELARDRISVNALAPGYIETDLNRDFLNGPGGERIGRRVPQRRFGRAGDLEGALLLLTAPAGGYMTGQVVTVDGGLGLSGL
tara:strand:+ start:290 stop:1048 length:759 start_codon:yes stop_codon:yes gene_type:complete